MKCRGCNNGENVVFDGVINVDMFGVKFFWILKGFKILVKDVVMVSFVLFFRFFKLFFVCNVLFMNEG